MLTGSYHQLILWLKLLILLLTRVRKDLMQELISEEGGEKKIGYQVTGINLRKKEKRFVHKAV